MSVKSASKSLPPVPSTRWWVLVRLLLTVQLMRLAYLVLSSTLVAGCASHSALPAATATNSGTSLKPDTGIEIRHMYLVAPGKNPVLIVDRDDGSSAPQEVSSEPPAR